MAGERGESMAKVGAPRRYKSVKAMQEAIDRYFEDCEGHPLLDDEGEPVLDKFGQPVIVGAHPPTVTGLALALGFVGRTALLDYQGRPEFSDTVLRAKSRIEAYAEARLYDRDGQRGAEFSLKYNFKWAQEERERESAETGVVMLPVVLPTPQPPVDDGADEEGEDE